VKKSQRACTRCGAQFNGYANQYRCGECKAATALERQQRAEQEKLEAQLEAERQHAIESERIALQLQKWAMCPEELDADPEAVRMMCERVGAAQEIRKQLFAVARGKFLARHGHVVLP